MKTRLMVVAVLSFLLLTDSQVLGRKKKVVIHVPYQLRKLRHTHTIYKTIHHHHNHRDPVHHLPSPSEEHEHFHHVHVHEEPSSGQHSQPVAGIGIPEFLPDVPVEVPIDLPDLPRDIKPYSIPLFRRV